MKNNCQYYELTLNFETSVISQASGTISFGVDTATQRYHGQPVLNGSLIRGNIRHTLEEFNLLQNNQLSPKIEQWFGKKSKSGNRIESKRAKVEFDFFWRLINAAPEPDYRTRISLDENGKVNDGHLQVTENPFPLGTKNISFSGKIVSTLSPEANKELIYWLNRALHYLPAIGSFKGIGFGKIASHTLNPKKNPYQKTQQSLLKGTRYRINLRLDRPFCLGRPKTPDSNRIVSPEVITGNVIKGIISRLYQNDTDKLAEELCFDELIISHALPLEKSPIAKQPMQRPQPAALSLAIISANKVIDYAFEKAPNNIIPAFKPDWKPTDKQLIDNYCQQTNTTLRRYLSVHTGIDNTDHKNIAAESQLFSLECIDPSEHTWQADIELCNIAEDKHQAIAEKLQQIFNKGLHGIGKTKAIASIECDYSLQQSATITNDENIIIKLITPARILPPALAITGINSQQALKQAYQDYWHQCDNDIELLDYFAQQHLSNSYYHQTIHQQNYTPEWLTLEGSIFKLKANSSAAREKLQHYLSTGLPAHREANDTIAHWKTTPYLPEHGFGEICLHHKGGQ